MQQALDSLRKPWIAVVLSFLCTGLGQIYCGRTTRGVLLLVASTASLPVVLLVAKADPSKAALLVLLAALLFVVAVYIFAVVDAYRLARRGSSPSGDRRLSHPVAYTALILFGLAFPVASTALVRATALQAFKVAGASMKPTLVPGDYFLAHRELVGGLKRGDIIVYHPPGKDDLVYVRRVAALAGDSVDLGQAGQPTIVPNGHCFVLGDNRARAQDSRHHSFVPLSRLVGRVHYVYYPPSHFGVLQPRWAPSEKHD